MGSEKVALIRDTSSRRYSRPGAQEQEAAEYQDAARPSITTVLSLRSSAPRPERSAPRRVSGAGGVGPGVAGTHLCIRGVGCSVGIRGDTFKWDFTKRKKVKYGLISFLTRYIGNLQKMSLKKIGSSYAPVHPHSETCPEAPGTAGAKREITRL